MRYSGFIIFASQIFSLVTGLFFTLLLTRNMTNAQFGVWSLIFYIIGLFAIFNGLFPFWVTRFAARGIPGSIKTGISANVIVGLIAALIYLPLVIPIMNALNIGNEYVLVYALASIQIFNTMLIAACESSLQAIKPQVKGYGLIIEEITKVALAFVLIVVLKQLFLGAMISLIAGASVQALFYTWLLKGELRESINWNALKQWLKGSTAIIYNGVGNYLSSLILFFLVSYASGQTGTTALGDYQAAVTFSVVIGYASVLAFALYPKMLAVECPQDVSTAFKTTIMLSLPMAAAALTMPRSLLVILKSTYAPASPILPLLAVNALIVLISQFYTQCLMGSETFDIEGKISLKELVKSKIFKVFTLPYIQAAIALPAAYIVLIRFVPADPVQAASAVVAISIAVNSIAFAGLYIFMRKSVCLPVAWKSIGKYVLGALVMGALLLAIPQTSTLTLTLLKLLIGLAAYTAVLYVIDADARSLFSDVWTEIKDTLRPK